MRIETVMRDMAKLRHSLQPGPTFDDWLLENGECFGPLVKRPKGLRLMGKKQCFYNTFAVIHRAVVDPEKWFYAEGMVMRANLPIPIHHAFLVNRAGEVMDLTLRDASAEEQYFGIPFKFDYVIRETMRLGYYGLFSNGIHYNQCIMESAERGRAWEKRA
jgi:hypothetical protein